MQLLEAKLQVLLRLTIDLLEQVIPIEYLWISIGSPTTREKRLIEGPQAKDNGTVLDQCWISPSLESGLVEVVLDRLRNQQGGLDISLARIVVVSLFDQPDCHCDDGEQKNHPHHRFGSRDHLSKELWTPQSIEDLALPRHLSSTVIHVGGNSLLPRPHRVQPRTICGYDPASEWISKECR